MCDSCTLWCHEAWLENPSGIFEMQILIGKSPINGTFSSKPCLITGGSQPAVLQIHHHLGMHRSLQASSARMDAMSLG